MKKQFMLALLLFVMVLPSHAEWSSLTLGGSGAERIGDVDILKESTYVTAGWTNSSDLKNAVGQYAGGIDGYFSVVDKGSLSRQVYVGGSGYDVLNAVAALSNTSDSVYVAGFTNSTDLNGTYSGNGDALVGAYDANGTQFWMTYIGGNEADSATEVTATVDMVYFAGTTSSNLNGSNGVDVFVSAFAANGTWVWTTQIVEAGDEQTNYLGTYNGSVVLETVSDFNETLLYLINATGDVVNTTRLNDFVSLDGVEVPDVYVSVGHNTTSGMPLAVRYPLQNLTAYSKTDLSIVGNYSDVLLASDYGSTVVLVKELDDRYEALEFDNNLTFPTNITGIGIIDVAAVAMDSLHVVFADNVARDGLLGIYSPDLSTPVDDPIFSTVGETLISEIGPVFGPISFLVLLILGIGVLVVFVNIMMSFFRKSPDEDLGGAYLPVDSSGPPVAKSTSKTSPTEVPSERPAMCRTCGEKLEGMDTFCSNCGTKI